jgi:hypothetical protein
MGIRDPQISLCWRTRHSRFGIHIPGADSRIPARVKRQRAVTGFHVADAAQRTGFRRLPPGGAFQHDQTVAGQTTCGRIQRQPDVFDVVRRIQQNQIEGIGGRMRVESRNNVRALNSIASLDAASFQVGGDERRRATVLLDEGDVRSAATERFNADRTGPGIAVEHARALDARRQDIEKGFAQFVGRRAKPLPRRRLQTPPFVTPGDYSHAIRGVRGDQSTRVRFALSNFNQSELILPSLLNESQQIAGQTAFLNERPRLVVRRFHDVAVAHEIAGAQLRQT